MGLFLPLPGGVFSRPGLGPAADLPFFDSSKKGRPKKDDPDARDPFAALRGNLRRGPPRGPRATHLSPRAPVSKNQPVGPTGTPGPPLGIYPPAGPQPALAPRGAA